MGIKLISTFMRNRLSDPTSLYKYPPVTEAGSPTIPVMVAMNPLTFPLSLEGTKSAIRACHTGQRAIQ